MSAAATVLKTHWSALTMETYPFRWAYAAPGSIIDAEAALHLARTFPAGDWIRRDTSDRDSGKRYRNYSLPIGEEPYPAHMPEMWRQLIRELRASSYRQRMAELLGQPVAEGLELRLVRHGRVDFLSPHTDSADKLFTMVMYFNEAWRESDGGALELLTSSDTSAVIKRIIPVLGATVILVPSSNSWHQVQAVREHSRCYRQSLLIHGSQ